MCTCKMALAASIPPTGRAECCSYSTGPCHEHFTQQAQCNACPCCRDICDNFSSCISCQKKQNTLRTMPRFESSSNLLSLISSICSGESPENNSSQKTYTMCQLRRHNHAESAWILVGNTIYDATPYIRSHPGGTATILRKAGGAADCTEDMRFHSGRAQKEWKKFKVGTLVACPRQSST